MYARSCSVQLWNDPFRSETSSGPSARAGLIEAFVSGPTVMMIATTTRPMTSPAQPSGERVSTMPRIVNMQDAGPERLDEHRRAPARDGVVEVDDAEARAEVEHAAAERRPDRERAGDPARDLRGPVGRHAAPREALRGGERERHRRVDVAARYLADRVDHRGHDQSERERDHADLGAGERRRLARQQDHRGHRARSDEDEQGGADELRRQLLPERVLIHGRYDLLPARSGSRAGRSAGCRASQRLGTSFDITERCSGEHKRSRRSLSSAQFESRGEARRRRAAAIASRTPPGPGATRGAGAGALEAAVADRGGDLLVRVAERHALADERLGGVGREQERIGRGRGEPLAVELEAADQRRQSRKRAARGRRGRRRPAACPPAGRGCRRAAGPSRSRAARSAGRSPCPPSRARARRRPG